MTTGTIGFTCFLGVASHTAGGFGLGMHGLFQPDKPAFFISGRRVTLAARFQGFMMTDPAGSGRCFMLFVIKNNR
jgi:hypothetical protein